MASALEEFLHCQFSRRRGENRRTAVVAARKPLSVLAAIGQSFAFLRFLLRDLCRLALGGAREVVLTSHGPLMVPVILFLLLLPRPACIGLLLFGPIFADLGNPKLATAPWMPIGVFRASMAISLSGMSIPAA